MPRKTAGAAASTPAAADPPEAESTAEDRAAARQAHRERFKEAEADAQADQGTPEGGIEDWTRPAYADNPGDFEFAALDDNTEFLSILWWGREGTGKTTDLARIAATKMIEAGHTRGRVLIVNAEGGAKRTPLRHHGIDTSIIDVYPAPGGKLTFEGLERLFYKLQADLDADPHSWAAVGWDSITAIFQKLLDDVIEEEMRKQAEILQRARKGRGGRSGNITLRDRFETDGDDYAKMSNQLRLLLRKYRTLPCHLLITALERRDEDKKKRGAARIQYGPAVNPAIATDLLGYMDIVIRTDVLDSGVYYGRTTPTEDARGKDRMFSLPVEMVDPTFDRVYEYIHGGLDPDTDPAQRRMPAGAEGIPTRLSLADESPPYHTQDGTPDGPPLAGDEDDPEPPKGRVTNRRSRVSSAKEAAATSTSGTGSSEGEPEPPKQGGRTRVRSPKPAAASTPPDESAGPEATPRRTSGRKTAAQREAERAKKAVQADTELSKNGGPATRAARQRAASKSGDFDGEPPF